MKDTLTQNPGVVIAVMEGATRDGRPLVRWGTDRKPRPARAVWMEHPPDWSACKRLKVILGFEDGDEMRPILLGLLDRPVLTEDSHTEGEEGSESSSKQKVVVIDSEEELVLQCGKAKISLRADGRVTILGGYLLSRSTGVNKIKGGSVHIN